MAASHVREVGPSVRPQWTHFATLGGERYEYDRVSGARRVVPFSLQPSQKGWLAGGEWRGPKPEGAEIQLLEGEELETVKRMAAAGNTKGDRPVAVEGEPGPGQGSGGSAGILAPSGPKAAQTANMSAAGPRNPAPDLEMGKEGAKQAQEEAKQAEKAEKAEKAKESEAQAKKG